MGKDLTSSVDDRQNILNTSEVVKQIEESLSIQGFKWRNETVFTKQQISQLLEISDVTIENYLNKYDKELKTNGYTLFKAEDLQEFRDLSSLDAINKNDHVTLAIFTFKAFLNLGMLVTESERAKVLRRSILDITMDVIAKNNGGAPKYIEFSDRHFQDLVVQEENINTRFPLCSLIQVLSVCVEGTSWKYAYFIEKIYKILFEEKAEEYRKILKLADDEDIKYSEVWNAIIPFEFSLAHKINKTFQGKGERLTWKEVENLMIEISLEPNLRSLILQARNKMTNLNLSSQEVLAEKLESNTRKISNADLEIFLNEKNQSLQKKIVSSELVDVFRRLKDR